MYTNLFINLTQTVNYVAFTPLLLAVPFALSILTVLPLPTQSVPAVSTSNVQQFTTTPVIKRQRIPTTFPINHDCVHAVLPLDS